MKKYPISVLMMCFSAGITMAQPKVNSVLNNYSFTLPGLPNYGIAQGSLFALFGAGIGPAQAATLPDLTKTALTTNLNGVTVSITVNGTTVQAPLYYVTAAQIAGILPSNTPVGTGTVTVSYNGQTSSTSPITVVSAAFGLLTLTGNGSGAAAVFDANKDNAYVTPTASANPGDTIILWGSGLGASTGDETKYPFTQTDLKGSGNIKVYIGGQPAQIAYAGRSQFPSLDQINVVIPAGVSGCNVGVIVQTGNYVSNAATISVATTGRTCSDPATTGLSTTELETLLNKGSIRVGFIGLNKGVSQTPPITVGGITVGGSTSTSDSASAQFEQYTAAQYTTAAGLSFQQLSFGSCRTFQFQGQAAVPTITPTVLDAGTLTMMSPGGSVNVPKVSGTYALSGSDGPGAQRPLFIPAAGGQFSFTNSGGADVGQISGAQITMPPALNWTNMSSITNIVRANGVTVNWDKTNPYSGFVTISGSSFSGTGTTTTNLSVTGFTCTAPYIDGTFTVPSYVLLALIPGQGSVGGIAIPTGSLSLGLNAPPVRFNAPSIDFAILGASSSTGKSVTYQ